VDETAHHGAVVIGDLDDPEEAAAEARGFLPEEILHQTDTGESGDAGHRRGGGGRNRRQASGQPAPEATAQAPEAAQDRGESRRELLLLLVDAAVGLRPVQSVDADRPSEPAGAAGAGACRLARLRRFHRHGLLRRRGGAIPHRLPGAGPDGVQQ